VNVQIVIPPLVVFVLVGGLTESLGNAPSGALIMTIPDPPDPPEPGGFSTGPPPPPPPPPVFDVPSVALLNPGAGP